MASNASKDDDLSRELAELMIRQSGDDPAQIPILANFLRAALEQWQTSKDSAKPRTVNERNRVPWDDQLQQTKAGMSELPEGHSFRHLPGDP